MFGPLVWLASCQAVTNQVRPELERAQVEEDSVGDVSQSIVPLGGVRLLYADSQETMREDGVADNALDGDPKTYWVTQWSDGSVPTPHELQMSLGGIFSVDGFRYLPRQDGSANGRIGRYEFYVSSDGVNWHKPATKGTLADHSNAQEVRFRPRVGSYVRLRILSEINGNPWTSIAEFLVLGERINRNQPPISDAGRDQDVRGGQEVRLGGGSGFDPDGDALTFSWAQISGRPVNLSSRVVANPIFNAPSVHANQTETLTFELSVSDGEHTTQDQVKILVSQCPLVRIMPLGDSITVGTMANLQPVKGKRVSYRRSLYTALLANGYKVDFVGQEIEGYAANPPALDPHHQGQGGWSATQIAVGRNGSGGIFQWLEKSPADIVLLHAGTNPPSVVSGIERILTEIDRWEESDNGNHVVVFVAQVIDKSPFGGFMSPFNETVKSLVARRRDLGDNLILVDHETVLRYPPTDGNDMADSVHPNENGYEKMSEAWLRALSDFLPSCVDQ